MLDYQQVGEVAVIHIDDGKANAINHTFIEELTQALERSRSEASAIALFGRPGRFSAGFDLSVVGNGGTAAQTLVAAGGRMLKTIYSHPQPVVIGCTGHAIAAGALILLAADSRIGTAGDFKIGLNETTIGAVLPRFALALADDRLSKRHHTAA
ncbi:MAG: enoyl-CoA hydratase-related protein, partial [Pseudomonadota bacterium]|nr:enoyl-CoA hydratase-related protein [Pseudomonadota bacterium]